MTLLAAHVIALLVPLLHNGVHGGDLSHHLGARAVSLEGEHHPLHPAALHDDGVVTDRTTPDLPFVIATPVLWAEISEGIEFVPLRSIVRLESRAPPGRDIARSPPPA